MNIEIILFGVIAFVLVLDFVLRGFKKKTLNEDLEKISDNKIENSPFSLNYFLARKRNFLTFILLTILLKPVFVFLISPSYIEFIDYEKKIERESFIDDKINLLNTYPTTRIGITDKPIIKGFYFKNFPKDSTRYKGINGHDSLHLKYRYFVKNIFPTFNNSKRGEWNWYDAVGSSYFSFEPKLFGLIKSVEEYKSKNGATYSISRLKAIAKKYGISFEEYINKKEFKPINVNEILSNQNFDTYNSIFYYDSLGDKIDVEVKFINFDKVPSKKEMIECCSIFFDFENDNFFDKNGNQLLHIQAKMLGNEVMPNQFYFYPLVKKVDSFRNHFKEIFKSKLEYFGISLILLTLIIFLLNDRITAR